MHCLVVQGGLRERQAAEQRRRCFLRPPLPPLVVPQWVTRLVRDSPASAQFILDHMGGPPCLGNATQVAAWQAGVAQLAAGSVGVAVKVRKGRGAPLPCSTPECCRPQTAPAVTLPPRSAASSSATRAAACFPTPPPWCPSSRTRLARSASIGRSSKPTGKWRGGRRPGAPAGGVMF